MGRPFRLPNRPLFRFRRNRSRRTAASLQAENEANCALLYGVTGSGKTQIYIKLIEQTLSAGKTAMLLVPEIALTPQLSARFTSLFGAQTAVIHSGLSQADRLAAFERVKSGRARIVIGTRSAVFSPLSRIGLIILDEEGEPSYKSDATTRRPCFWGRRRRPSTAAFRLSAGAITTLRSTAALRRHACRMSI